MTTGTPAPSDCRGEVALLDVGVGVHPDDRLDVTQAAAAGGDVDVLVPGRMDERLLDDGDEVGVEHLVAAQRHQSRRLVGPDRRRPHLRTDAPSASRRRRAGRTPRPPSRTRAPGRCASPDPRPHSIPAFHRAGASTGAVTMRNDSASQIRDDQEAIAFGARRVLDDVLDEILAADARASVARRARRTTGRAPRWCSATMR